MMRYKAWKLLQENIGSSTILGFGTPNSLGVINSNAQYAPVTNEAGKQPVTDDVDYDDENEDGDDDGSEEDDDDEFAPKELKSKKGKGKCDCGCKECKCGDKDMDEGLSTFFCDCPNASISDGKCGLCKKYALQESMNLDQIADSALEFYRGEDSNLYKLASYISQRYTPSQETCDGAVCEIEEIFKESDDSDDKASLAKLHHAIQVL